MHVMIFGARIGRYADGGQFNLHFSRALVKLLAAHRVNLRG